MVIHVRAQEHSMGAVKNLVIDVLESLQQSGMDYELTAQRFEMTPQEVYELAKEYGDVE